MTQQINRESRTDFLDAFLPFLLCQLCQELHCLPVTTFAFFFLLLFLPHFCGSIYHLRVLIGSFRLIILASWASVTLTSLSKNWKLNLNPFPQIYYDIFCQYNNIQRSRTGAFCVGTTILDYTLSPLVIY